MPSPIPNGFRLTGTHCGLKQASKQEDLTLIVSESPCAAAGVYTKNLFPAAPVVLDRRRTPSNQIRAIVANSGNANACTGDQGMRDAERMAQAVAEKIHCNDDQVLVLSTGIIGEHLPMKKIEQGISDAAKSMGAEENDLLAAARGILTTDTHPKVAYEQLDVNGQAISVCGIAKGAAMIGPNMATMLGIVLTDAMLNPKQAQIALTAAVEDSFHCISVEGHTSTNDTVLLLGNGNAGSSELNHQEFDSFCAAVQRICVALAKAIPGDAEGATHRIEIHINNAKTQEDARIIAKTVADSALVKTAICGADPNWGRIVSAVGYAGVDTDPEMLVLRLNGTLLFENASPVPFDQTAVSNSIRNNRETLIEIDLNSGPCSAVFWTSDLTAEYVRLNADYHT